MSGLASVAAAVRRTRAWAAPRLAAADVFVRRHWPWLVLLALSVIVHLVRLDARTFHHDESVHAKLSWDFARSGAYHYDPTYHGPLLYMLVALTYKLFGASDFTARLPIAVAGIGLVGVAWCLRRPFGERAAWWTGLLFTVSPTMLFFSRFLRMDMLELATASAAFASFAAVVRGSKKAWTWVGIWTGLAFATKENAFVTAAVAAGAALLVAFDSGLNRSVPAVIRWVRERWPGFVLAIGVFVLVTVPLYTVGLTRPEDWLFPLKAISHWWQQHSIERVPGPWWFYIPRLLQYEFLILGAALVWIVRRWRKLHPVEVFLFAFGVGSVAMYAYLGEKVPWLIVHQTWAFVPLAGAQLARTFSSRGRRWSQALAGAALVCWLGVSFVANFVLEEMSPPAARVESIHFVQTTPQFMAVTREALHLTENHERVSVSGQAAWPLSWYLRDQTVMWSAPTEPDDLQMVICDVEDRDEIARVLGPDFDDEIVPLRAWFLMYAGQPTVADWMRYFFTRVPWNGRGSTDVAVFRRVAGAGQGDDDLVYWDCDE